MNNYDQSLTNYSFGFKAITLRPELFRIYAEKFIELDDIDKTKECVLKNNLLQTTTLNYAKRIEVEIRNRIKLLTKDQINILANSSVDSRAAISWLAAVKQNKFIYDYVSEVLRSKIEGGDPVLRQSDYEGYIHSRAELDNAVGSLSDSTQEKVKKNVKTMLREAGILVENNHLTRPVVPHDVFDSILQDNKMWFAGFLYSDAEIQSM